MAVPSASGSGIINKPVAYGASSQVTSDNLNQHVDNAVFNANAVDGTTINADDNGKNLFVVDGSISVAKTSFLGTVDTTADSNVKILSKQSDGQYDSVTPSGDATITQAGAITIANDAVTVAKTSFLGTVDTTANSTTSILSKQSDGEYDSVTPSGDVTMSQAGALSIGTDKVVTDKILNSNVTLAKIANIADDRVLGNISGGSAAPSELTAANLVTLLGTNLINPTTVATDTKSVTFSNGLIVKFGTFFPSSDPVTVNFSDYGGDFPNECFVVLSTPLLDSSFNVTSGYVRTKSTSNFTYNSNTERSYGASVQFIAIGR